MLREGVVYLAESEQVRDTRLPRPVLFSGHKSAQPNQQKRGREVIDNAWPWQTPPDPKQILNSAMNF